MAYITLAIAIIGSVLAVTSFFNSRKDKSNDQTEKDSYKWGRFEEKLDNLGKQMDKVLDKLDGYDEEIDNKIDKKIKFHVEQYHTKG